MPRILHAADLHLSEVDKSYSLSVFQELVETAIREHVDYFLFCGDLFNTFSDAEKLRSDFRKILGTPPFEFFFLPGNHEELNRGQNNLARLDWGAATILESKPFSLLRRECGGQAIEFLAIPHQTDYGGYGNWKVTPKENALRITMAHGVVAGMSYRGPDEEEGGAALDPDLFQKFQSDYVALGHIHGMRTLKQGETWLAYPGSSKVWRKNEMGPRGAFLLDWKGGPVEKPQFLPLSSAGQYRTYTLPLYLEGNLEANSVETLASSWSANDYIDLNLTGLVEDELVVAELETILLDKFRKLVRRIEIHREDVSALPGIASHPLVSEFLSLWEKQRPTEDSEVKVWLKARELGLNAFKTQLERRS